MPRKTAYRIQRLDRTARHPRLAQLRQAARRSRYIAPSVRAAEHRRMGRGEWRWLAWSSVDSAGWRSHIIGATWRPAAAGIPASTAKLARVMDEEIDRGLALSGEAILQRIDTAGDDPLARLSILAGVDFGVMSSCRSHPLYGQIIRHRRIDMDSPQAPLHRSAARERQRAPVACASGRPCRCKSRRLCRALAGRTDDPVLHR